MSSRPEQIFLLESNTTVTKTVPQINEILATSSFKKKNAQSILNVCRVCASSTELVIPIFEKEGLENSLADKIHKYLPIQVSKEDCLPKVVCYQCTTTIISWHDMVATCVQADAVLRNQHTHIVNTTEFIDPEKRCDSSANYLESVKTAIFDIFDKMTLQEGGIEFICKKCNDIQFSFIEDLSSHLETAHASETSPRSSLQRYLTDHIAFTQPSTDAGGLDQYTTYRCPHCERRFTSTRRLLGHLHVHYAVEFERGVTCCECVYDDRRSLEEHLRRDHREPRDPRAAHACRGCGHRARDAAALRAHVLAEHAPAKPSGRVLGDNNQKRIPAACPHCDKLFSNKYAMRTHARTHFQTEAFQCPHCSGWYSTRGNLAAHVRASHGGAGGAGRGGGACPQCGEQFARSGDLRRHEARHSAARLQCAACPARFHHADSLRRHALAHRDVRPHACPRCPRAFRRASHLAAHRAHDACRLLQAGPR